MVFDSRNSYEASKRLFLVKPFVEKSEGSERVNLLERAKVRVVSNE